MKKQWIKNGLFCLLCLITLGGYLFGRNTSQVDKTVSVESDGNYHQIVYEDADRMLIPITYQIAVDAVNSDDLKQVFSLMKSPGSLSEYLHSFVPDELELVSTTLDENGNLNLDFSSALEQVTREQELRFLEGLVFVYGQFEGVNSLTFSMAGDPLSKLPQGEIDLTQPLTRELGINNFESSTRDLHHTTSVVVYYAKQIGNEELYVPVSKRLEISDDIAYTLNEVLDEVSVTSTLTTASCLEDVVVLEGSSLEDGHLLVNLNSAVLLDESTINQDIYDLLLLSFSHLEGVEEISLQVQGENLGSGEASKVSEIVYNTIRM